MAEEEIINILKCVVVFAGLAFSAQTSSWKSLSIQESDGGFQIILFTSSEYAEILIM